MSASLARPRLEVRGLSKSFGGVRVLHSVSFEAFGGRVLGIVGENGSGKSTTLNAITGVLSRDDGQMRLDGSPFDPASRAASAAAGVAFIQQEVNVFPNLTVAENLLLVRGDRLSGKLPFLSPRAGTDHARALLQRVELPVPPGALAGTLAPGQRQLLEIARELSHGARIFILDEPTTALTALECARLFKLIERLKTENIAVLYVSHNLNDVLTLADDILVMRDGRVTLHAPRAGLTAEDLVLAMVGRPIEALFPHRLPSPPGAHRVLEVQGLSEPGVLADIHLHVRAGEIVGLAGLMGAGRTELARAVFGLDPYRSGSVKVNGNELVAGDIGSRINAGAAFLTEDRRHEGLMLNATVAENFALAALPFFTSRSGRIRRAALLEAMRSLGQRLNLRSGSLTSALVRTLSGGNQQKVMLGRWLLRSPKLFILDEPTRGVDVGAKEEIYRLLCECAQAGMGILMISSELEELIGVCDRICVMHRGAIVAEFDRTGFDGQSLLRAAFGQELAA